MIDADCEWVDVKDSLPEQHPCRVQFSDIVNVLLDNGDEDEDWLINGRWVFYCEKNIQMPHVVAWRKKNEGKRDGTNGKDRGGQENR